MAKGKTSSVEKTITVPSKNNTLFVDSDMGIKGMDQELFDALKIKGFIRNGSYVKCFPMGSRCIPGCKIHEDTDFDYMFYIPERKLLDIHYMLWEKGFELEGGDCYEGSGFLSYRKEKTNFIVTSNEQLYNDTQKATQLCVFLGVVDKETRIKVYDFFRGKNTFPYSPSLVLHSSSRYINPFYLQNPSHRLASSIFLPTA